MAAVTRADVAPPPRDRLFNLARFVCETDFPHFPEKVAQRAKFSILDNLGCGLLGSGYAEMEALRNSVGLFDASGSGPSTMILGRRTTSAFTASLLNASYVNVTELGEGVARSVTHPGTVIVPATLAYAEELNSSGPQVIEAVVLGYEALIRLGWALAHSPGQPVSRVEAHSLHRGWYPPALLGGFGVAVAAAKLRRFDVGRLVQAMGIYANIAPTSLLAAFRQGAMIKSLSAGWAAAFGLFAARLAEAGYTGVADFDQELFQKLVEAPDYDRIDSDLGESYEIMLVDVKFFACAGPMRTDLECTFQLLEWHPIRAAEVAEIQVETNQRAGLLTDPLPTTPVAAKFSLPYCIAQIFLGQNRAALMDDAFSETAIRNPQWRDLARRVQVRPVPEFTAAYNTHPKQLRPSRVTVVKHNGERFQHYIETMRGLPTSPPSADEYVEKFKHLARRSLSSAQVDDLVAAVTGLETEPNISRLMGMLRQPA
ncbi:MAG: MmgE/PrpD family protein [Ardenticatenaceae bacterium]|nr:MmgE/PrpD family protein [Ardenticatenaceae bacterium]